MDASDRSSQSSEHSQPIGALPTAIRWGSMRTMGLRSPNLLKGMNKASARFQHAHFAPRKVGGILPEEGSDLHRHFQTCASLTRIREEFRNAMAEDSAGLGPNVSARPERDTGRLLLHSIGLNSDLITSGGGGAAAQSRVNHFVLKELLPANHAAIVEEDKNGLIPFTEPIVLWVEARRAVRKFKIDTDRTREKVALVAAKLNRKAGILAHKAGHQSNSDSDSEDNHSVGSMERAVRRKSRWYAKADEKMARMELKMIVESSQDAMFCIDEKGQILLTNDAAVKQFGWTKKEFTRSNISIICNPVDAMHHGKYLERYLRTGEKRVMGKKRELLARKKDGTTFQIELGLTEVNLGGGKYIFCGFVTDLTELNRHRTNLKRKISHHLDDNNTQDQREQASGIPPLVEWCLTILSEYLDNHSLGHIGKIGGGDSGGEHDSADLPVSLSNFDASYASLGSNDDASTNDQMRSNIVVDHVSSIPNLLEELVLIDDLEARNRVFDMSIIRKVLFNIDSIGDGKWFIEMLDKSIRVQQQRKLLDANLMGTDANTAEGRALQLQLRKELDHCRFLGESVVFYLEKISEVNIHDDLRVLHNVAMIDKMTSDVDVGIADRMTDMLSTGDVKHFRSHRNELWDTVGQLKGLIRRICVLEDDLVKRAAATAVIKRFLDKVMFSPYATIVALFDGCSHLLLMISFRMGPAPALFHLSKIDDSFQPQRYLLANTGLIASVFYFGTKAVYAGMAKYYISENLFWKDATSFWTLLDICPLFMVLSCSVAVDLVIQQRTFSDDGDRSDIPFFLRGMISITTPLLWLRLMAFVKMRNRQLATFILCSVEIVKDIKWFLLVLAAAMASFAQMWESLTFEADKKQDFLEGYIKAYTMMLGDLDPDSLKTHPMIALLFVVYTFGVTIVLLNILIAIVGDSYQNSFVSSKMMLGKARVMFVAELASLRTFHDMLGKGTVGLIGRKINFAFGAISILHIWRVTETIKGKLGHQNTACGVDHMSPTGVQIEAMIASFFLLFMLFAMRTIISYVLNEFNDQGGFKHARSNGPQSQWRKAMNWFIVHTFSLLTSSLDMLSDSEDSNNLVTSNESHEHRAEKSIQQSIEKTRKNLKSELKSMFEQLQESIHEVEEQNRQDMVNIEEHISNAMTMAIAESQRQLMQTLQEDSDYFGQRLGHKNGHSFDSVVSSGSRSETIPKRRKNPKKSSVFHIGYPRRSSRRESEP